jgi:hypothetical protein
MQVVLSDHNCAGQAQALFQTLEHQGYLNLVPMQLRLFADVGLAEDADDETVWRLCQKNGYLLLTGNRKATDGDRSLEMVIRRLVTAESLPVVTISSLRRVLSDPAYCHACALRLAEIALDLADYQGLHRIYLPG